MELFSDSLKKDKKMNIGNTVYELTEEYRDDDKNVFFRRLKINVSAAKNGGGTVRIAMISDPRFNSCDIQDLSDPELPYTFSKRTELAFGESAESVDNAMAFIKSLGNIDKTIVTGNLCDYLSHGAITLVKRHILSSDLNVTAVPGRTDFTKKTGTHTFDTTPLFERVKTLKAALGNDMFYRSEIIGSVMIITMINATKARPDKGADSDKEFSGHYLLSQKESLIKDLDFARKNKLFVLIFESEPLFSTVCDINSASVSNNSEVKSNFNNLTGNRDSDTATDKAVYSIISNGADVIKGVFCGADNFCATKLNGDNGDILQIATEPVVKHTPFGSLLIIEIG